MKFKAKEFDVVLDKAFLDCLVCCENKEEIVKNYFQQVSLILKQKGVFIIVSHTGLDSRKKYLNFLENFDL